MCIVPALREETKYEKKTSIAVLNELPVHLVNYSLLVCVIFNQVRVVLFVEEDVCLSVQHLYSLIGVQNPSLNDLSSNAVLLTVKQTIRANT